jgi:type II secretory pathway component GspD/PulD (secretin)
MKKPGDHSMKVRDIMRFGVKHFLGRCSASSGAPLCIVLLAGLSSSITQAQNSVFRDEIRSFDLNHAVAVDVAEILNEQFPLQTNGFSANKGTNTIYVRIPDELVPEVNEFIERLEMNAARTHEQALMQTKEMNFLAARQSTERQLKLQIYALQHVGAEELLAVIGELGFHNEQLSIAAEPRSNSIVARGDAESLKELETLLLNLDKPGEAGSTTPRFDSVELAKLKREYQTLLSQFGGTHPKVVQLKQQVESLERLGRDSDLTPAKRVQPVKSESQLRKEYEAAEQASAKVASDWPNVNGRANPDGGQLEILRRALLKQVRGAFHL